MKKIYTLAILMLTLAMSSCQDLLNLAPEDTLSPETFFENEQQLALWTNQFYAQMPLADNVSGANADDMVDSELGEVIMGQRSAAGENGWKWDMLRDINYYLQHSHQCADKEVRNHYDGVAYFMRAYFYFDKVKRYGDVPWYNQVLNSKDDKLLFKERDSRGLVIDSVIADLDKAITLLPKTKDVVHITKWTALALKSRVTLFEGTFRKYRNLPDAEKYLKQAIDAGKEFIQNSGYTLYTKGETPYRDLFNSYETTDQEVILVRKYSKSANITHSIPFHIISERAGFTKRFMNHYLMADGKRFTDKDNWQEMTYLQETQNRDPRMAQTVLCPGYVQVNDKNVTINKMTSLTGYTPIKYVGAATYDGANKAFTDLPLFRAAEVYLNFAEAKAEMGVLTQQDLDISINKIRERARMPHLILDEANLYPDELMQKYYPHVAHEKNMGVILEIRRERTIELVMEGFRLWDLIRWKEGQALTQPFEGCYFPEVGKYDMDGDQKPDIQLYDKDKGDFKGTSLQLNKDIFLSQSSKGNVVAWRNILVEWDENRDYLWPIPADERVLTGGILTQNPGWQDGTNFNP